MGNLAGWDRQGPYPGGTYGQPPRATTTRAPVGLTNYGGRLPAVTNVPGGIYGPLANFANATGYSPFGRGNAAKSQFHTYTPSSAMKKYGAPLRAMTATMPMQRQANQLMNFRQSGPTALYRMRLRANPWLSGEAPESVLAPIQSMMSPWSAKRAAARENNPLDFLPFYR